MVKLRQQGRFFTQHAPLMLMMARPLPDNVELQCKKLLQCKIAPCRLSLLDTPWKMHLLHRFLTRVARVDIIDRRKAGNVDACQELMGILPLMPLCNTADTLVNGHNSL